MRFSPVIGQCTKYHWCLIFICFPAIEWDLEDPAGLEEGVSAGLEEDPVSAGQEDQGSVDLVSEVRVSVDPDGVLAPEDRGVRGRDSEVRGDLAVASSDLVVASLVGALMAYAAWYLLACTACAVAGCCKIASAGRAGMALPVLEVLQATDPEMF